MRTPRCLGPTLLLLMAVAALVSGCFASPETQAMAVRLEDRLGEPGWADRVQVDAAATDGEGDVVTTTVTLRDDATPEELTSFLSSFAAAADAAGVPSDPAMRWLVFQRSDKLALQAVVNDPVDESAVRAGVARWFAVVEAARPVVEEIVTGLDEGDGSLQHDVYTEADVDEFFTRVGAEPLATAAAGDTWRVQSTGAVPRDVESTSPAS